MMSRTATPANTIQLPLQERRQNRVASLGNDAAVLADVYRDDVNIAIWQRELNADIIAAADRVLAAPHPLELSMTVSPGTVQARLEDTLATSALTEDIVELVSMFSCLFEAERIGLRLTVLDRAMCPRFHVDNVPCRFITTYQGPATEWLPHEAVDRSRLGRGNRGMPDAKSGLYGLSTDVRQMNPGDVALLKGELWEGNENAGLVHRSPGVGRREKRLVLTLDMLSD